MRQRFVQISLDGQVASHVGFAQGQGGAGHQLLHIQFFVDADRKGRLPVSDFVLCSLVIDQERRRIQFPQKMNDGIFFKSHFMMLLSRKNKKPAFWEKNLPGKQDF